MLMWCDHCGGYVPTDGVSGRIWCSPCGRVLADDDNFLEEAAFARKADQLILMEGNIVKSTQAHGAETTQKKALDGGCEKTVRWCLYCVENVRTDEDRGRKCCSLCGRIISDDEDNFTSDDDDDDDDGQVINMVKTG